MKKSIELSFIKFLRQKKIIVLLVFLIPQLLSFGYLSTSKQNTCYAEAKLTIMSTKRETQKYIMQTIEELKKQGKINFSKFTFPYLEFEGSNSQCIEEAKKAQKIIFNLDLNIKNEIQEEKDKYQALREEYQRKVIESPTNYTSKLPPIPPTLYKDLGFHMAFFSLSKILGTKYRVIILSDGKTVDKLKKKIFIWILGGLVLSFLTLFTIFFKNYLFGRI